MEQHDAAYPCYDYNIKLEYNKPCRKTCEAFILPESELSRCRENRGEVVLIRVAQGFQREKALTAMSIRK